MGHRLVRLLGDPSPWADPAVSRALVGRLLPLPLAEQLAFYGKWQMQALVAGTTERCIGIGDGFSRSYCFGPHQYAVWMEDADAAHLFANEWERWQFLDITETPWQTERPPMTKDLWRQLLTSFAKLGRGRRLRPAYRDRAETPPRVVMSR